MRKGLLLLGLLGVLTATVSGGSAAATAVGWGHAGEVPGTATLNSGGDAGVSSVSCATAGACAAGGYYNDGSGDDQAFVVSERRGRWSHAIEVPGTATLNSGGDASLASISCAAADACVAGGAYTDGSGHYQAFVVREGHGRWGHAIEVPGTATLNGGGNAEVNSVSCATAGACAAGGYYTDGSGHTQAFVVSSRRGRWGHAVEVPGTATLNSGGIARVYSVSCAAAGACAAGGQYKDGSGYYQAFVVRERNGRWGHAIEVPGTATLNSGGNAEVNSVSCATAGACGAGGVYRDGSGHDQVFVVSSRHGRWGHAIEVPGTATLNSGGNTILSSVSCAAADACVAGGTYADGSHHGQAFVVSEQHGRWGQAIEVPGTATLNSGGIAQVNSVSCATAGACAAAGFYEDGSTNDQAFVVSSKHGRWGHAIEVPGTATLNVGSAGAQVNTVSCALAGACVAGGYYGDSSDYSQAFVVKGRVLARR